jgi:hypothetical protein
MTCLAQARRTHVRRDEISLNFIAAKRTRRPDDAEPCQLGQRGDRVLLLL